MRRFISTGSVLLGVLFGVSAISAQTPPYGTNGKCRPEQRFDASINPAEMGGWMKTMAADAQPGRSPHNKANAGWCWRNSNHGAGCAHRNL